MSNGCTLRLVTITKGKEDYEYITNIYDLPDEYIEEIYERRWSIEGFFKIIYFLRERMLYAIGNGIRKENIAIDPGIGFGKRDRT